MNSLSLIGISDLFILLSESQHQLTPIMGEYHYPKGPVTMTLTFEYYNALHQNILIGEALLEKMAEEVAHPTINISGDHDVITANCTIPFLDASTSIQKDIAESHDMMITLEQTHSFLLRPEVKVL